MTILTDVEDRDDVVVVQGGGGPRLAEEALLRGSAAGQVGKHHLDGHLAPELRVFRQEDDAHAPAAQDLQDPKAAQSAQLVIGLRRGQEGYQAGIRRWWLGRVRGAGDLGDDGRRHGRDVGLLPRSCRRVGRYVWVGRSGGTCGGGTDLVGDGGHAGTARAPDLLAGQVAGDPQRLSTAGTGEGDHGENLGRASASA